MAAIDIITRYFPQLTPEQIEHFTQLDTLYRDWNAKINVISRKDIDALYEHHVLHSLGIAQMIRFKPGTHILDFGTGGWLPRHPLGDPLPRVRVPAGRQHREEGQGRSSRRRSPRAEERAHATRAW